MSLLQGLFEAKNYIYIVEVFLIVGVVFFMLYLAAALNLFRPGRK